MSKCRGILALALVLGGSGVSVQAQPTPDDDPSNVSFWSKPYQFPLWSEGYDISVQAPNVSSETTRLTAAAQDHGARLLWSSARVSAYQRRFFTMAPAEARTLATDWAGLPQTTSVQHHDFGDGTHPEPELRRKIRLILDQSRALDVDAIPAISGVLLAKLVRLENDLFQADLASSRAFIMLTVTDERQNRIGNLPQLPRYIGSESPPLPAASTERERLMKAASRWPPGYWDRTSIPVNCMPYQLATAVVQVDGLRGDSEGAEIPTLPFPRYTPDCFANGVPRGAQITGRTVSFQVKPMTGNILRLDSVADCGSDRFAGLPASPIRADRYAVPIEKLQDARRDLERIGRLVDWDGGADCDQVLNRERERREALHAERAAAASALEKAPIIRTIVDIEDSILELPISSMTANGSTVHLRVAFTHTPRSTSGDGAR